jgi:hypothetical protein
MTPDLKRMVAAARHPFGTESGLSERDAQYAVLAVLSELLHVSDELVAECFASKMATPSSVRTVLSEVCCRIQKDGWP